MVRVKNRYIVFQIKPRNENIPFQVSEQILAATIKDKINQLHGDFGLATVNASFYLKYCNKYTNIAIIKSRHGPHKLVSSCLPFITQLNKKPVDVHILYVGATIKHCLLFTKNYQQDILSAISGQKLTEEEKLTIKEIGKNLEEVTTLLGRYN